MVGSNIHVAEQLPCLLNHIAIRQREETALVPLSGFLLYCGQLQRSSSATPTSASSICSPQPDQVGLLQFLHITLLHIFAP